MPVGASVPIARAGLAIRCPLRLVGRLVGASRRSVSCYCVSSRLFRLIHCRSFLFSSSPQSSHPAAQFIAHSLVRLFSYQAMGERGTWQRAAENGINETNEARHGRRYRTINHLISFSPDPLLRAIPSSPTLKCSPAPEAGDERAAIMIAWRAWRWLAGRAVLSASCRSPCGSLSLFHPSIIGSMAGRIIYAPFLSAQLPVRGMGMEHRHERIGGGTQGGTGNATRSGRN